MSVLRIPGSQQQQPEFTVNAEAWTLIRNNTSCVVAVLHMTAVKCRMKTGAGTSLWVVGMRCHSKENYGWPKERHNRVHACWLRFCFMLLGDLEDASLS